MAATNPKPIFAVPTDSRADNIIGVAITCIVSVTVVCLLRIYTRARIIGKVAFDDYLIILGAGFTIVCAALSIAALQNAALGKHVWLIPIDAIRLRLKPLQVVERCILYLYHIYIMYACGSALTRLSIIASYLRIIPNRHFRLSMYATAAVVILLLVVSIFCISLQCIPVRAAWDTSITDKKCLNYVAFLYASGSIGLATDVVLVFVPVPLVWGLHLPQRQKISLTVLFGIAIWACVAGAIRLAAIRSIDKEIDVTFRSANGVIWSVIECAIGIVCVSIPPLRPLFFRLAPLFNFSHISTKWRSAGPATKKENLPLEDVEEQRHDPTGRHNVPATYHPGIVEEDRTWATWAERGKLKNLKDQRY